MKTMPVRRFLTAGLILLTCGGCMLLDDMGNSGGYTPPPPAESYNQDAIRNTQLKVIISWSFQFSPADPNGAGVWANETAPRALVDALNTEGVADGNSFVLSTDGSCNINLNVYEYTDGDVEMPRNSLKAEMWAMGHQGMVCSVSTGSTYDPDEGVEDLARRLNTWLHTGWHTN